jgi:hypothetical protein
MSLLKNRVRILRERGEGERMKCPCKLKIPLPCPGVIPECPGIPAVACECMAVETPTCV